MKKFFPLILFLVGVLVVVGTIFIVKSRKSTAPEEEEGSTLLNVKLIDRPVASLTPSEDGHWLTLKVEKIKISAESMDYELLYQLPDGRTQGVPGTITLKGLNEIERKLLLGSESSGKFRYDEGVKKGSLTLRFRDKSGKLLAKFATDFALLSNTKTLASADGNFSVSLTTAGKGFYVVMESFGVYSEPPAEINGGPYGLFSSQGGSLSGTVKLSGANRIYQGTKTQWLNQAEAKNILPGIFVGAN